MFLDGRYQKQPCPKDKRNKSNVAYLSVNPITQKFIANIQKKNHTTHVVFEIYHIFRIRLNSLMPRRGFYGDIIIKVKLQESDIDRD